MFKHGVRRQDLFVLWSDRLSGLHAAYGRRKIICRAFIRTDRAMALHRREFAYRLTPNLAWREATA